MNSFLLFSFLLFFLPSTHLSYVITRKKTQSLWDWNLKLNFPIFAGSNYPPFYLYSNMAASVCCMYIHLIGTHLTELLRLENNNRCWWVFTIMKWGIRFLTWRYKMRHTIVQMTVWLFFPPSPASLFNSIFLANCIAPRAGGRNARAKLWKLFKLPVESLTTPSCPLSFSPVSDSI